MAYTKQSVIYSVIFHLLILLVMFLITFQHEPSRVREFIEIIAFEFIEPPREQPIATAPPAQPMAAIERQPVSPPQPIEVPAQQIDVPTITTPVLEPAVDISQLPQRADRNVRSDMHRGAVQDTLMRATVTTPIISETPQTLATNQTTLSTGVSLEGFSEEIRTQMGTFSQYRLDGDVINRLIVSRVVPEFPESVMRNGTVTMQFTVVENGSVQNITVIRRSEPEFEAVSVAALRQWVFNRADRSHTGQITFNFRRE